MNNYIFYLNNQARNLDQFLVMQQNNNMTIVHKYVFKRMKKKTLFDKFEEYFK